MRTPRAALLACWVLSGCPESDPASGVATATDSSTGPDGTTTSTSTTSSTTSSTPEPEPETAGSACGAPLAGQWADCINGNTQVCGNEDAVCLANSIMNPAWGACMLPCEDRCDCWAAPEGSDAEPACASVLPEGGLACVLDCTNGQACPDGMRCVVLTGVQSLCAFESDSFDPTGGTEETTGDATSTGTSSSGGDSSSTGGSSGSSSTGAM